MMRICYYFKLKGLGVVFTLTNREKLGERKRKRKKEKKRKKRKEKEKKRRNKKKTF